MSEQRTNFLSAMEEWVCDDYSIEIRYIAKPNGPSCAALVSALVILSPVESQINNSFRIQTDSIWAGQIQRHPVSKAEVGKFVSDATNGKVFLEDSTLDLAGHPNYDYHSEMSQRDRWFSDLHLWVGGSASPIPSAEVMLKIDNDLRRATPPFDGTADLVNWLGIDISAFNGGRPSINLRISPPADLMINRSLVSDDQLTIEIHAHPALDVQRVSIASRSVPGNGILGRRLLTSLIDWCPASDGIRKGIIKTTIPNSDSVLTMLMIGSFTVRRQWFVDSVKARDKRWVAVQHFDANLQKLRDILIDMADVKKFEQAVASLFFLLGFAPGAIVQTDAPDLIIATPSGQLLIVECTTRVADFSVKLGKLVDRRGSLSKALTNSGHPPEMLAVLVCGVERDQIAIDQKELRDHKVLLLTKEDLIDSLDQVRYHDDPDKFVQDKLASLKSDASNEFFNA